MKLKILFPVLLLFSLSCYSQELPSIEVSELDNSTKSKSNGSIAGVNPNGAMIYDILTVQISGTDTHFAMGTGTDVWFSQGSGTLYPIETNIVNNTLINSEFMFPYYLAPGYYDVNTNNITDGHLVLENGFYLDPYPETPYLDYISPNTGIAGEMITITAYGKFTHFSQVNNSAKLTNNNVWFVIHGNSYNTISDTIIEIQFPLPSSAPTGMYNIEIYNPLDGSLFLYYSFSVSPDPDPPYLTSISPDNGAIPETLTVSISGENTHFSQGTGTIVRFKQGSSTIYPNWVNAVSNDIIQAEFSFDDYDNTGYYDVKTVNALDGELTLNNGFYLYPDPYPPHLVSVEPSSVQAGESLNVEISGQYTHFSQGSGTIVWIDQGGYAVFPTGTPTIVSDELISADFFFPEYFPIGFYDVNTENVPDGHLKLEDAFEVIDTVTSIRANSVFEIVNISPNPNNGKFTVSLQLSQSADISMVICDLPGNRLQQIERKNIQSLREKINTNGLSTGIYILKIYAGNNVFVKKIIIAR